MIPDKEMTDRRAKLSSLDSQLSELTTPTVEFSDADKQDFIKTTMPLLELLGIDASTDLPTILGPLVSLMKQASDAGLIDADIVYPMDDAGLEELTAVLEQAMRDRRFMKWAKQAVPAPVDTDTEMEPTDVKKDMKSKLADYAGY